MSSSCAGRAKSLPNSQSALRVVAATTALDQGRGLRGESWGMDVRGYPDKPPLIGDTRLR